MSTCNPCLQACSVPLCTAQIILGTISSVSTDAIIIIENKGTGRKQFVSTQSDGAGVVTLVTSGLGLMAEQTYEISVVLKTSTALCNKETLTIGTSTTSCVTVLFENILGDGGCQVAFDSQTLTVPENTQPGTTCICITQEMWDNVGGGCCDPITHTVAEMQALVGNFQPNSWYIITNPQSSFGVLRIRARDVNNLEQSGTLIKSGLAYTVSYSLTDDVIVSLRDDNLAIDIVDGNAVIRQVNAVAANLPLNNTNYVNVRAITTDLTIDDPGNCQIAASDLFVATIAMNHSGALGICSITNTIIEQSAVTLNGVPAGQPSTLISSIIRNCGGLTMTGSTVSNLNADMGGNALLFINENISQKFITIYQSNISKIRDITGLTTFNFDNAGYDESFAGSWSMATSNPTAITLFANNTIFPMTRTFFGANGAAITITHDGVNIFCNGGANAVLASAKDFITFRFEGNKAYEVTRGIY